LKEEEAKHQDKKTMHLLKEKKTFQMIQMTFMEIK